MIEQSSVGLGGSERLGPYDSDSPDGVSLVIPAYNESGRIVGSLTSYLRTLKEIGLPFEIIVVSDGTDDTPSAVMSLGDHSIRVMKSAKRLGKGGAIISGFRDAKFLRVGYTDADGSLAPASLKLLISGVPRFDCVFGSRWMDGSTWLVREPWPNMVASRVFSSILRALLDIRVKDTQCGAKFYSAAFLRKLLPRVFVDNLTTDVSFVYHSQRLGGRIAEVPVTWTHHVGSRFRLGRMAVSMFVTVVGMRLANSRGFSRIPPSMFDSLRRVFAQH